MTTQIVEIRKQEWIVIVGGHTLRQHYFTAQTAQTAALAAAAS